MADSKVHSIHLPYAHCNQCCWKFQWHPALKPQGGVCTANLTPSFLHHLGARLYTASPSCLHRTTDLSSFAFSWLVRSYVGLSFRPYTPYITHYCDQRKPSHLVPPSESPEPLSLAHRESCTTVLRSGPRRLLFPDAGVCCHQCTVLVPPRLESGLPTSSAIVTLIMFEVLRTYFSPSTRIGRPAMKKLKDDAASKPHLTWLLAFFVAWKLLLLGVACASPGPGYDTSTRILFDQHNVHAPSWISPVVEHLTLRLTRWDGLYFSTSSARGHLYEQEWAFSWFMSRLTAMLANGALSHLVLVIYHGLSIAFSVSILSPRVTDRQPRSQRHTHIPYLPLRSSNHLVLSCPPRCTSRTGAQT